MLFVSFLAHQLDIGLLVLLFCCVSALFFNVLPSVWSYRVVLLLVHQLDISGLTVPPANSNLVLSGLGLRPERVFVFVLFCFVFSFSFLFLSFLPFYS